MKSKTTSIALSPDGIPYLLKDVDPPLLTPVLFDAFVKGAGFGLIQLGISDFNKALSSDLSFWREFSHLYFSKLCAVPGISEIKDLSSINLPAPTEDLTCLIKSAPPMMGGEYLTEAVLSAIWGKLHDALTETLTDRSGTIQDFLAEQESPWNLVGRVCFHLAENKASDETPFAFIATYSHSLSFSGKAQHRPLGRALEEYAGAKDKSKLLQLLIPVQKAAKDSKLCAALVDSGEIFHPLAWTPTEAFQFLKDIPLFEAAGVIIRVPDWWKAKKPPRPQVSVTVGGKKTSNLGINSMLEFSVDLTLDGEQFTEKEIKSLLALTSGLALIRGKWVEIDRDQLKEVLDHWKQVEKATSKDGISFIEGMRLLSGAQIDGEISESTRSHPMAEWTRIEASDALHKVLEQLRDPGGKLINDVHPGNLLKATLRPYQQVGLKWLWVLNRLGLGACLADDMGLGKTIQIISLFLLIRREQNEQKNLSQPPNLLVVPASLLGNWKSEIERFAPVLRYRILHPSVQTGSLANALDEELISETDVVITTYGYLNRMPKLYEKTWNCLVIDEAQAIKNSGTRQTQAVKRLKSIHRIALTGTPVENRLSDLWSLYDFLMPGLLGSGKEFEKFMKGKDSKGDDSHSRYASLRNLVQPYILRRLKTDKSVLQDLPDKTEVKAFCALSKTQAALYLDSVQELAHKIKTVDGIKRRGLVLSYLIRLKQICNHPSQWLADGKYELGESGKFLRLTELAEEIASKQEKVLIFTQYKEIIEPLSKALAAIFGKEGFVLHGGTPIKKRKELVDAFQARLGASYFVLSLKAGGTGLNLTAASHVIHFDRWWNPAVENQATDRAYRIGQKRNVLVHKFICKGTIEERIDEMIFSKQNMSQEILEGTVEANLTELSNDELIKVVSLDIRAIAGEV